MEENRAAPVEREKRLRNTATRRARWLSLNWRLSRNGNRWIRTKEGFHVVVFRKPGGWGGRVQDLETKRSRIAQRTYPAQERAMLAAFDAMIFYLDTR